MGSVGILKRSFSSSFSSVKLDLHRVKVQKIFELPPSLVGGFNPFEKYSSNWIISPGRGENKKSLKPPPNSFGHQRGCF